MSEVGLNAFPQRSRAILSVVVSNTVGLSRTGVNDLATHEFWNASQLVDAANWMSLQDGLYVRPDGSMIIPALSKVQLTGEFMGASHARQYQQVIYRDILHTVWGLFDVNGHLVNSVIIPVPRRFAEVSFHPMSFVAMPSEDVVKQLGIHHFMDISNRELAEYIKESGEFFSRKLPSEAPGFAETTGFSTPHMQIPIEVGIKTMRAVNILRDSPELLQRFYKFLRSYRENVGKYNESSSAVAGMNLFLTLSDELNIDEIEHLVSFWEKQPSEAGTIYERANNILRDLEMVDQNFANLIGNPLASHLHERLSSMIQTAIKNPSLDNIYFTKKSLSALEETLDRLYFLPTPETTTFERLDQQKIMSFQQASADPANLSLVMTVFESWWLKQLLTSYIPGQYQEAARRFYSMAGPKLNEIASETTGDTTSEIERFYNIINWAVDREYMPKDFRFIDLGCGNGRLLKPILAKLQRLGIKPKTLGIDLIPQEIPADAKFDFLQADMTDKRLLAKILTRFQGQKANIVTMMWSPFCDVIGVDSTQTLMNAHAMLENDGLLVVDLPKAICELFEYHANHPDVAFGEVKKAFGISGTVLEKLFNGGAILDIYARAIAAGFVPLNVQDPGLIQGANLDYTTRIGKRDRVTIVFQKKLKQSAVLDELILRQLPVSQMPA